MPQFRKKPVEIEARQWLGESTWDVMYWCNGLIQGQDLYIQTLEGEMRARPGDWIIKGVKGEFYPCREDIFEQTYEAA